MHRNPKVAAGIILVVAIAGGIGQAWRATADETTHVLTLHAEITGDLAPRRSVAVRVTADGNRAFDVSLQDTTLTFVVTTDHIGCTGADFTLPAVAAAPGVVVHPGDRGVVVGASTLTMVPSDTDQDACQGATITVDVVAR